MNNPKSPYKTMKHNLIQLYTQLGYFQRKKPVFCQVNFMLQFFFIFTFKSSLFSTEYNPDLHDIANRIVGLFVNHAFLMFYNIVVMIPVIFFAIWTILQIRQDSRSQFHSTAVTPHNLKKLTLQLMIIFEWVTVPCMTTTIRWIYLVITDPGTNLSIGLLVLYSIGFSLACAGVLLDPCGMLLRYATIPIIIFIIAPQWNNIAFSVISMVLIISQLQFNSSFGSTNNRLATIFKFLLVYIFALDLTPDISNAFFILFMIILVMIPMVSLEPEYIKDNIEVNNFILNALDILNKQAQLPKEKQVKVLKQLIKYEIERPIPKGIQNMKQGFIIANTITYHSLMDFFRIKIAEDMSKHKKQDIYKLQHYLFEVKHNNMPNDVLWEVTQFSEKTKYNFDIKTKVYMHEVHHQINKKINKQNERLNLHKILQISNQIDITNEHLDSILNHLVVFWTRLQKQELTCSQVEHILKEVEQRQEHLIETINQLEQYSSLNTQTKIYNYSLKVSNFNYQHEEKLKKQFRPSELKSICYVVMSQCKIVSISNQILLKLRKKKQEVLDKSLQVFLPLQIVSYVEEQFAHAIESDSAKAKILPLINIKKRLLAYRVELKTTYSLASGVQQVINFLESDDLQQQALFFYDLSSDRIIFANQLFINYMRELNHKIDHNTMGFDLFGSELSLDLSRNNIQVNYSFSCTLSKESQNQCCQLVGLKVIQIFQKENSKCMLLAVERSQKISELAEVTIFSMKKFMKQQSHEQTLKQITSCSKSKVIMIQNGTLCPIANSFQTHIDQSLAKIKIYDRMTHLRYVKLLMMLLVLLAGSGIVFVSIQTNKLSSRVQLMFSMSANKAQAIESCLDMLYLYYRYYQIRNYPEQILRVQNYNMSYLNQQYFNITNSNISFILNSNIMNVAMIEKNFTMHYKYYNQTKTTNQIAVINFLSDIKQALQSNDPTFSVKNEYNLDIILSAYQDYSTQFMEESIKFMVYLVAGMAALLVVLTIGLKVVAFRIHKLSQEVLQLYENIPKDVIRLQIRKFKELKAVTLFSDSPSAMSYKYQNEHRQVNKNENVLDYKKIKRKSFLDLLMSNNLIIFLFLGQIIFIFWIQMLFNNYSSNIKATLVKQQYLQDAQYSITKPAEKFYQVAMNEILPVEQRNISSDSSIVYMKTDHISNSLPSYFKNYLLLQSKVLENNLCQYDYLNENYLYIGLNCSAMLNGVMEKTYPEVYAQYKQLIRNYTGVPMSKLGDLYRIGALYPVYMEICYVRRNFNVIFTYLKEQFSKQLPGFINHEKDVVLSLIYNAIYTIPILLIVMILQFKRLKGRVNATIRAFKMIPKEYLLKMSVTKYIKNEKLLQKMESL